MLARKTYFDAAIFFRQLGLEFGEDVEFGRQGDALVEILGIAPGPEERLASGALQTFDVDLAAVEDLRVGVGEIVSDDRRPDVPA